MSDIQNCRFIGIYGLSLDRYRSTTIWLKYFKSMCEIDMYIYHYCI